MCIFVTIAGFTVYVLIFLHTTTTKTNNYDYHLILEHDKYYIITGREKDIEPESSKVDEPSENKENKEKPARKRKWGSSKQSQDSKVPRKTSNIAISTDSLKVSCRHWLYMYFTILLCKKGFDLF